MISFKQLISEARDAPLYHGTNINSALQIIHSGFKPYTFHEPEVTLGAINDLEDGDDVARGVSLTRSLDFAKSIGKVVFEIDQRQLTQRFKVIPVQYFMWQHRGARGLNGGNEYEEFVITKKNIPFSLVKRVYVSQKYIEEINRHRDGSTAKKFNEFLNTVRQKHGSSFIRYLK